MCITVCGNDKCLHHGQSIRKLEKSGKCSANGSVRLCCWRQVRWRSEGLWHRAQSPPNSLLPVSTSLCRPQSCGLLWEEERLRKGSSPLNPNETTVSVKQGEGRGQGPKFSLLSSPCLRAERRHLSPSLFVSSPSSKSAIGPVPHNTSPVPFLMCAYICVRGRVCMSACMCAIWCFIINM